jgi:sarcosine oxidase/L-pipecolate oxidase
MAEKPLSDTAPILIVGAGVFGLSTALHLGQRGYSNVTVLDKQPYDKTLYSYEKGCDAASAGTSLFSLSNSNIEIENFN